MADESPASRDAIPVRRGFDFSGTAAARDIIPGLAAAIAMALAAYGLRTIPGVAVFSPIILSMMLGMAAGNLFNVHGKARPGLAFAARKLLRLAIILLGLQITLEQVAQLGIDGFAIIVISTGATLAMTIGLGKLLGLDFGLTQLIAAGTSICGASAIVATSTVAKARDEAVAYAIACITLFGTMAVFLYPLLTLFFEMSPRSFGIWAGASIHEIAQVVAAAFQYSSDAGEFATIAKLSRVILLAPVLLIFGALNARRARSETLGPVIPPFVLWFLLVIAINSVVTIPGEVRAAGATASGLLLSISLAALGAQISIARLIGKGWKPLLLAAASSLFIAGLSLALLRLFS